MNEEGSEVFPRSRLARSVVHYLQEAVDYPYANLLDFRCDGDLDVVDVELEVELAQDRSVEILPKERVRIFFLGPDDSLAPRVMSLRENFPIGEVHTYFDLGSNEIYLCIWEESWQDLSRNLTGQALVERIRWWFARMADGTLHADEQNLEPLIATTSHTLVFPPGTLAGPWFVTGACEVQQCWTLIMGREPKHDRSLAPFDIFYRELPSQVHRALESRPYNFAALRDLLARMGYNFLTEFRDWMLESQRLRNASQYYALLIFSVPVRRSEQADDETVEIWAYMFDGKLAELGEKLQITATYQDGGNPITGAAISNLANPVDLESIPIFGWRVVQRLDATSARKFAGSSQAKGARLVAIGAGAIGSNVIMNTTRSGLGTWTVIDNDVVLPHNTVRQSYMDWSVGRSKAMVMANQANHILAGNGNEAIVADVLHAGADVERIADSMKQADLVVDFSASPSVVGHLSDQELQRAASLFFSPDGADLVLLAECSERAIRLDEIEAQYFLAVATSRALKGHLAAARTDAIRYANACQDLSRPLPPWQVQMLSGLAAGRLSKLLCASEPVMSVWRLQVETGSVIRVGLPVQRTHRFMRAKLCVSVSASVISTMRSLRANAHPNETGGVLVGTYDLIRNALHIVAALPAPQDSEQSPTYFIRGSRELQPVIEEMSEASAGRLNYVGEWHSHPDRAAARPSSDDENVFDHLRRHLEPVGSPYTMMICGKVETWLRIAWQDRGQLEDAITHAGN